MVDRNAHFSIRGYDERFYLYAEDDDYCLRMRRDGRARIIFTPHAKGFHLEHQSTNISGSLGVHLNNSNQLFGQLWGWYLTKNSTTIPGTF